MHKLFINLLIFSLGATVFETRALCDPNELRVLWNAENRRVLLRSGDCRELELELRFIQELSFSRGEYPKQSNLDCTVLRSVYSADITDMLPLFIRRNFMKVPTCQGPNCHNASLMEARIVPTFRYMSPQETIQKIEAFCTKIDPFYLKPGDLGVIRDRRPPPSGATQRIDLSHTFTFIGKTSFTKNGYENAPYTMIPTQKVFSSYEVDDDVACRFSAEIPSHCLVYVNYYRCGRTLRDLAAYIPQPFRNFEVLVSNLTMSGHFPLDPEVIEALSGIDHYFSLLENALIRGQSIARNQSEGRFLQDILSHLNEWKASFRTQIHYILEQDLRSRQARTIQ